MECDCDGCCSCLPCCRTPIDDENELYNLRRVTYSDDTPGFIKAVLQRDTISDKGEDAVRRAFGNWLADLTTQQEVMDAYAKIAELPRVGREFRHFLKETAQLRCLAILNAKQKIARNPQSANQSVTEEKMITPAQKAFLKDPRFHFFCSSDNTSAFTLFQQVERNVDITKALKAKTEEVESAFFSYAPNHLS